MKKIFTLLFLAAILSSCGSGGSSGTNHADTAAVDTTLTLDTMTDTEKEAAAKKEPPAPSTKWTYEEKVDKMTSKKKVYASITSDNELQFEFPYDGGSAGSLLLRKNGNSTDVLLTISKGQFNTNTDGTSVMVRFDDNKASSFSCGESSDGSSDVLFIHNEKKFIAQLKKSKKLIIQAEFYESGLKEMEFTTAGLKWD